MTRTQSPQDLARPTVTQHPVPGPRVTAVTLTVAMVALTVAEQLIDDLDEADDIALITAGGDGLAAGGLILLVSAILLGFAAAGLGRIVWPTVTGRIGWVLLMVAVPCAGAFAMFHLLLLETGAAGLDPAAMQQFVTERFHGPGPWGVPVGLFALAGPLALLLVLVALARLRMSSSAAPLLFLVGALLDQVPGDGSIELVGLWVMALAVAVAAVGLWRSTVTRATDPAPAAGAPLG